MVLWDEIRKKKEGKPGPKKNQKGSDFTFLLRESSFGVFNVFRVSKR